MVYGRNPVTSKKEVFVTNVKVFQSLTVVEKRFPLDVSGFPNPTGFRKSFSNVAGFLNLPMVILSEGPEIDAKVIDGAAIINMLKPTYGKHFVTMPSTHLCHIFPVSLDKSNAQT